jgi:hypothetical protein
MTTDRQQDLAVAAVQRAAELALALGVTENELITLIRNESASARSTAERHLLHRAEMAGVL